MNEFLQKRILRKLESLPDERAYQVLDYIEFLESRYGRGAGAVTSLQKIAETVQDTLRAGRLPAAAIRGTMDAVKSAGRVMEGLSAAGKAVVDEVTRADDEAEPRRADLAAEDAEDSAASTDTDHDDASTNDRSGNGTTDRRDAGSA